MPFIESSAGDAAKPTNIYYEDRGSGKPLVFIHGWPLNGNMWEYQTVPLIAQGYRCITYDRRGFGRSDRPGTGFDYDTLALDLKALLEQLNLQEVTLIGFSMAGGEIAKYFANHKGARIAKLIAISTVMPYMAEAPDNKEGVPKDIMMGVIASIQEDRPAFLEGFAKDFYGVSFLNHPVSPAFLANNLSQAMNSSATATIECAKAFSFTDMRADVPHINVPTLIIHGNADKTVPIDITAKKLEGMIPKSELKVYKSAAHGLWFTHKQQLTQDIIDFVG